MGQGGPSWPFAQRSGVPGLFLAELESPWDGGWGAAARAGPPGQGEARWVWKTGSGQSPPSAGTDSGSEGTCAWQVLGPRPRRPPRPPLPSKGWSSSVTPPPVPRSKAPGEREHSSPPSDILLCLKPLRVLGPGRQRHRRPHAQRPVRTRPQELCSSHLRSPSPDGEGGPGRTPPAPPARVPNTNSRSSAVAWDATDAPCIFRIVAQAAGPRPLSEVPFADKHIQNCPVGPGPMGLARPGLGVSDPGRGAGAWAPGTGADAFCWGQCPSEPRPSQGSHVRPRPADQPPAGPRRA